MKRVLLLAAVLAACQSSPLPSVAASPNPVGVRGGDLVMADWEYPDNLDPLHATTESDLRVAGLLFEPLWTLDAGLQPLPRLLSEMPVPKLGRGGTMTLDLNLRPGLRWSDGLPLTADDLIFAVNAICSAGYPGRDRAGFDHIASQERRSPTEVIWHFGPRPAGSCGLAANLTSGVYPAWPTMGPLVVPLPAHRLGSIAPAAWAADPYFQRPDVVSGPFKISGVVPGRLIQLAANPDYASGRGRMPWLDGITYRVYDGKAALISGLQTGEADLGFHLLPADLPQLADVPISQSLVTPTLRGEFVLPNHTAGPWAGDAALLSALAGSVDPAALNSAAFNGYAEVSTGLFPPPLKDYDADPPPGLSVAQAKAALDADGWTLGADGVRAKGGRRLAFSLLAICDDQVRQLEQAELVRQWGLVGAAVSAVCEPRQTIFSRLAGGAFEMALLSNAWPPDPGSWATFGTRAGSLNWGRCSDPGLDADFAGAAATLDSRARRTGYHAAAQEWLRQTCSIPLLQWPAVVQRTARLHGFEPNPMLGLDSWNAADWWLSAP
ncbi:MAG TPA: ABC transporter substrate-binding protein [Candidatus Dormibacteraeota bacterium]|nr:ABC transporter substrate-binding protein [Candidatus Dormibacteraeota bacterium]